MHSNCRLLPEDIVCKITQRKNIRRTNTCDPALKLLNEEIAFDIQKHKQNIFLGEILSAEGIRPSDDRISVINNMMKPQNREEVQRLLGLVNYVGKYIVNLSNRTTYIRTLLCKNTDGNWSHEHENDS